MRLSRRHSPSRRNGRLSTRLSIYHSSQVRFLCKGNPPGRCLRNKSLFLRIRVRKLRLRCSPRTQGLLRTRLADRCRTDSSRCFPIPPRTPPRSLNLRSILNIRAILTQLRAKLLQLTLLRLPLPNPIQRQLTGPYGLAFPNRLRRRFPHRPGQALASLLLPNDRSP